MSALDDLKSGSGSTTSTTGKVYLDTPGGTKTITLKRSGKTITAPIEGAGAVTKSDAKKRYLADPKVQSGWLVTLKKYGGSPSELHTQLRYLTTEIQWQRIEDRMKTPGKSINRYMDYAYSWIGWGHHGARTSYAHEYANRLIMVEV